MLGAIIGDIVGSRFEHDNIKTKKFDFLTYRCKFTDDSVMSLAIAQAILVFKSSSNSLAECAILYMQELGRKHPRAGYGGSFINWIHSDNPMPYNSWGNGAAMRVSACGFAADSLEEALDMAKAVTEVTHNHPEGIKGAQATAAAIYMAKSGKTILEIQDYINKNYYNIDFTVISVS